MKANKNGVKWTFFLLVHTSREINIMTYQPSLTINMKSRSSISSKRYQNILIVPASKEVRSVKHPYLLIFSIFQFIETVLSLLLYL